MQKQFLSKLFLDVIDDGVLIFLKQNSYARHSEIKFASSRWLLEKQLFTLFGELSSRVREKNARNPKRFCNPEIIL